MGNRSFSQLNRCHWPPLTEFLGLLTKSSSEPPQPRLQLAGVDPSQGLPQRPQGVSQALQHLVAAKEGRGERGLRSRRGECRSVQQGAGPSGVISGPQPINSTHDARFADVMSKAPSSNEEMAERLGVSAPTVWRWKGQNTPALETMRRTVTDVRTDLERLLNRASLVEQALEHVAASDQAKERGRWPTCPSRGGCRTRAAGGPGGVVRPCNVPSRPCLDPTPSAP